MRPNISEFSYGFAITDELIHSQGTPITAAPVFPSLYQEGQPGGGYDVMLQRPGIPLFLQFKLSQCMVRPYAREAREGWFTVPYYRMDIRSTRHSDQHEMLLDLENAGNEVYYSAPAFHQTWEFNEAYLNHDVTNRSMWFRPSWIGPLPDDSDHHVAFQLHGAWHFWSEPRRMEGDPSFESFVGSILAKLRQSGEVALQRVQLYKLAEEIAEISQKRRDIPREVLRETISVLGKREPIEQIAFYSHMFLEAQLFIVFERKV